MANPIASFIFCARNVDKAETQGKVGRLGVAAGQAKNVVEYVSKVDHIIGKTTKTAVDALKSIAKEEKVISGFGKAVDFASKNVNFLICASSGIDVLMAKDKEEALIVNATALGSMFAVEKMMKNHMHKVTEIKGIDKIAKEVMAFSKTIKHGKAIPQIISGVAFVTGSVMAYGAGEKAGKSIMKTIKPKSQKETVKTETNTVEKTLIQEEPKEFVA